MAEPQPEFDIFPETGTLQLDWLEPFEWQEPPQWHEALDIFELADQMLNDPLIEAGLWLLYNRERAARLYGWQQPHSVPAAEHYRHTYLWDTGFTMGELAQAGQRAAKAADYLEGCLGYLQTEENRQKLQTYIDQLHAYSQEFLLAARQDAFWVVNGQKPDGFIAGTQYTDGWLFYEVEKGLSIDRVDKSTHYSQPPNLALGTMSIYKAMKEAGDSDAYGFLETEFYYLNRFMEFFHQKRRDSPANALIGVIDPHETGQDSATRWDRHKPNRKPRNGPYTDPEVDDDNRYIDGTHAVMRQLDRFIYARNNLERQRRLFWELDVSMNAIYFHNLQVMAWLSAELAEHNTAYQSQADKYRQRAAELSQAMKQRMWITDLDKVPQPGFYNLGGDGVPNPDVSPNNVMALVVPDLGEEQLDATLDMMDDHLDVEFPFPSASVHSPNYDPHNHERDRLWRGSTWMFTNYYIVEFGLRRHAKRADINPRLSQRCADWADRVALASNALIDLNHPRGLSAEASLRQVRAGNLEEIRASVVSTGAAEYFHPHNGSGQRTDRVRNFGGSWLARLMQRPGA